MLSELGGDEAEGPLRLGRPKEEKTEFRAEDEGALNVIELVEEDMDWDEFVSGTKRVLSMDVSHLSHQLLPDRF